MIIERQNNELLVRIPASTRISQVQTILDYLRYEDLTSKSSANEGDIVQLVNQVKKGRWNRIKKELGI